MARFLLSAALTALLAWPVVAQASDAVKIHWQRCRAEATVEGERRSYWSQTLGMSEGMSITPEYWAAYLTQAHGVPAAELKAVTCRAFPTPEAAVAWSAAETGMRQIETDYASTPPAISLAPAPK